MPAFLSQTPKKAMTVICEVTFLAETQEQLFIRMASLRWKDSRSPGQQKRPTICRTRLSCKQGRVFRSCFTLHVGFIWEGGPVIAPVRPSVVAWGNHIAVSTDRTVKHLLCGRRRACWGRFWRLYKRSRASFMYHPTCESITVPSMKRRLDYVRVWQITMGRFRPLLVLQKVEHTNILLSSIIFRYIVFNMSGKLFANLLIGKPE